MRGRNGKEERKNNEKETERRKEEGKRAPVFVLTVVPSQLRAGSCFLLGAFSPSPVLYICIPQSSSNKSSLHVNNVLSATNISVLYLQVIIYIMKERGEESSVIFVQSTSIDCTCMVGHKTGQKVKLDSDKKAQCFCDAFKSKSKLTTCMCKYC